MWASIRHSQPSQEQRVTDIKRIFIHWIASARCHRCIKTSIKESERKVSRKERGIPRTFWGKWGATSRYIKGNDVYHASPGSWFVYGGFMAVYVATAPRHTGSSIIIITSLTLGAGVIDGEPLMTLGWNCYYHKSDTEYLKRWCLQLDTGWTEHRRLSSDYLERWIKQRCKIVTEHRPFLPFVSS